MSKTKIIGTIGPASSSEEVIKKLIQNGMDVARINLSHASHDFCRDVIKKINKVNKELKTNVAIMLDTFGPNVQIGNISGEEANLIKGDKIRIYMHDVLGDHTKFSVNYHNLLTDVRYGSIIKIDDGKIDLEVIDKDDNSLLCEVENDGVIYSNKSLNVPGVKLNIPFLSKKDKEDIIFAHEMNVDFLALSFVSTMDDILEVTDLLIELGDDHMQIIAKAENESAIDEIDEIIKLSDGVMVARGDLGVEIPLERVPGAQKMIISKCHNAGKVSIVATEMLSSMENGTRPTRAEVSDIANAVLDGVDSVMLSGETTIGKYPVETLSMMEKIISSAERDINYVELLDKAMRTETEDVTGSISHSVTDIANRLRCKAIVAPTISGYTARKISRFRPSCSIIAMSPKEATIKSLALNFGVNGILVDELKSFDKIIETAKEVANKSMHLEEGDKIIITGGYPFKEVKHTNFMKIEEI